MFHILLDSTVHRCCRCVFDWSHRTIGFPIYKRDYLIQAQPRKHWLGERVEVPSYSANGIHHHRWSGANGKEVTAPQTNVDHLIINKLLWSSWFAVAMHFPSTMKALVVALALFACCAIINKAAKGGGQIEHPTTKLEEQQLHSRCNLTRATLAELAVAGA